MPIKFNNSLSADRLRELLTYHPGCGLFTWNRSRGSRGKGVIAGNMNTSGAIQVQIDKEVYVAHRLAWLYMTGVFPENEIDHENLEPADNRWVNLRPATHAQNCWNRRRPASNTSGFKGVCWHAVMNKWCASIMYLGTSETIGYFDDPQSGHAAYVARAKELFGEFARAS